MLSAVGPSLKNASSYLSAAVLSGLLRSSSMEGGGDGVSLNLVSAPALAKDLGIKVCKS